jgi:transposase InsO family protein
MPWRQKGVMDQRIEFVLRVERKEASLSQLCEEYGISRPTGYLWLQRYREAHSFTALQEHSRRPHHSPTRTPEVVEGAVLALRDRYGWGARKLRVRLQAEYGLEVPVITVHRILQRYGRVTRGEVVGHATQRFAREAPNQLWQMDFKGKYAVAEGVCHPLQVLDDHSRYLLGLWPLPNQQAALEGLFQEVGVPEELLLDRGVPWWSTTNGHGLTWLSVWLLEQDLGLIYGRPYHPQTRGKLERSNRTLDERTRHQGLPETLAGWEVWGPRYRREYNEVRPHEALAMQVPAQVWAPVHLRPYRTQPRGYDYGEAPVQRLNPQGCLTYGGRRYFVCEALAQQWVRVDELEARLLVTYRATMIREIDMRTGRSRAILQLASSALL